MKVVTKQEFLEFVFAQPDEKELNFSENESFTPCGCPMVHYGKHLGFLDFVVGTNYWYIFKDISRIIAQFAGGFDYYSFACDATNYGELKQALRDNDITPDSND